MLVDLLIFNIGQLVSLAGEGLPPGPRRGETMRSLGIVNNAAVAIRDGRVWATGSSQDLGQQVQAAELFDAGGRTVVPGFVDPHTHLPWAGERAAEFEMRIGGATYMEIMAAGGGIARTVSATRDASLEQLVSETRARLDAMLANGTTTAEAKTGYGLNLRDEIKQLDAIAELQRSHPIDLVPSFLGAHAVPPEYGTDPEAYIELLVAQVLPAMRRHWGQLQDEFEADCPFFCDVFCETRAFDLKQSRRILVAAKSLGFALKMHVDEFAPLGGTLLAVSLGAVSADHIVTTPSEHLAVLARSDTIGVALPGTPFGLAQRDYAPGRALIDAGGALALATDLNPGTCWCESMPFMIALACRYMRLSPAEALTAATVNAAHAIGLGHRVGSLEPGKLADLVVLDGDDYRMLGYRFGANLTHTVIKRGKIVWRRS
jgi:imidazolonepropionase